MLLPYEVITMRCTFTLSLFLALAGALRAQVAIDKSIQLVAPDESQRQVIGVPTLAEPSAVQAADQEQSNAHRIAPVTVQAAVWVANIESLTSSPAPGTHIVVIAPEQPAAGEVQVMVNGNGPFEVVHRIGDPLIGDDIAAGSPLSLVFDGTRFHALSGSAHRRRDCPEGMKAVTDQFCTEIDERTAEPFFDAALTCTQAGRRLCTWGEWINACQLRTSLGLLNMINNWEFTDDTANEDNTVRFAGPSCTQAGTFLVNNGGQAYRCCLTR